MIDLTPFCGTYEWKEIVLNGSNFILPDVEYCCRFIILLLVVYFFIKGIFNILSLFT